MGATYLSASFTTFTKTPAAAAASSTSCWLAVQAIKLPEDYSHARVLYRQGVSAHSGQSAVALSARAAPWLVGTATAAAQADSWTDRQTQEYTDKSVILGCDSSVQFKKKICYLF